MFQYNPICTFSYNLFTPNWFMGGLCLWFMFTPNWFMGGASIYFIFL